MTEQMNYLELIERLMATGMDEDSACKEAYAAMYPEKYDPEDYE